MRWCDQKLRRSIRSRAWALMLAIAGLSASGCEHSQPAPLRIAAASDLQLALPRLVDRFQATSATTGSTTFGASGQLAEQIKQGAPFDVFLSANETFVRDLADGGFIEAASVHRYARGSLVLAVYRASDEKVQSLDDLKRPEVKKIALANPAIAPYGKAGKQALVNAGLWEQLEPKIVIAESVRQALLYVQKGDVEAALVGRAIAKVPETRTVEVDPKLYDPIVQALGVVSATKHNVEAQEFVHFVLGAEGRAILKEFGFASGENGQPTPSDHGNPRSPK